MFYTCSTISHREYLNRFTSGHHPSLGFQLEGQLTALMSLFFDSVLPRSLIIVSAVAVGILFTHAILGYVLDAVDWVLRKIRSPN